MKSFVALTMLCVLCAAQAIAQEPAVDPDPAYTKVINERADKIVATLKIEDAADALRVRDLIAGQYRALSVVHAARDAKERNEAEVASELSTLHRKFVAQLEAQLTPEQVEAVKDGLTYGVVPITYRGYLELLPDLTAEQKIQLKANLLEAREYAMDAGSSDEKHAWFGKYKGRINNYLSKAGIDMKKAEQARAAR